MLKFWLIFYFSILGQLKEWISELVWILFTKNFYRIKWILCKSKTGVETFGMYAATCFAQNDICFRSRIGEAQKQKK